MLLELLLFEELLEVEEGCKWCEKRISFAPSHTNQNDGFTKTGSGQTDIGKLEK